MRCPVKAGHDGKRLGMTQKDRYDNRALGIIGHNCHLCGKHWSSESAGNETRSTVSPHF